jgi:hypothetical protein
MSSIGSPSPFFLAGKKAHEVERSLRFSYGDSANLTRTSSSASTTFTYSAWIKRARIGEYQSIFSMGVQSFTFHGVYNTLILYDGSTLHQSARVFRDPSAWYHIVVQINSGVATSYVNNVLVHNAVGSGFTLTTGTNETRVGSQVNTYYFNGYQAEINFVDGSVLAPSSFAETDAITGQWNPKKYVGSYGTNGFYLNFSDNSGTTATTLGKDSSGNGNNFTPNNFSVAAGAGNDSVEDTPTNNFPTFNPIFKNSSGSYEGNASLTEGNLSHSSVGSETNAYATFALPSSGKYYWEVRLSSINTASIGIIVYSGNANRSILFNHNGTIFQDNASSQTGLSSWSNGDIIGVAYDGDNQTLQFYRQGSSQGSALSITAFTESYFPISRINAYADINFGQRAFSYTPPTGFKTLCSANLPDPTIKLPNKHFGTLVYTGDGSASRTISDTSSVNFTPSWVWAKNRSQNDWHILSDAVRGFDGKTLYTNRNDAEYDASGSGENGYISAAANGGFVATDSDGSVGGNLNANSENYVAWNWNAGDTDGKTYTVTVVSDSGNKYRFDGFGTSAVTLDLAEGGTYIFDQSDSSNAGHPLRFSTTSNGTHGGGSEYTTGVTTSGTPGSSGAYTQIVVAASAPTLYYYCTQHSGMGGQANTNSTLGSSNFDGSRQSTVKVNATAGFSIVTSTSGGSSSGTYDSFGHGLGVAPNVIIFKNRDQSDNWSVYNSNFSTAYSKILQFNTIAETTSSNHWGTANPTSTTFSVNQGSVFNGADQKLVAYCFSEVSSYSKFGKYTGNGSSNGTFVFTGFRPAFVMIKCVSATDHWNISDAERGDFNEIDEALYANNAQAEGWNGSLDKIDYLSNGFKPRANNSQTNASGGTYIYLAFAEAPFRNARAR